MENIITDINSLLDEIEKDIIRKRGIQEENYEEYSEEERDIDDMAEEYCDIYGYDSYHGHIDGIIIFERGNHETWVTEEELYSIEKEKGFKQKELRKIEENRKKELIKIVENSKLDSIKKSYYITKINQNLIITKIELRKQMEIDEKYLEEEEKQKESELLYVINNSALDENHQKRMRKKVKNRTIWDMDKLNNEIKSLKRVHR